MTETKATPREKLEFSISNKPPLIGTFNGQSVSIGRIKLSEITETWSEIIKIMRSYRVQAQSVRSDGAGDTGEQVASTEGLFDILDEMGPGVVNILHTFIRSTTNMTDEQLNDADFWSLTELVIIIMEHNIGKELTAFFGRGADVLKTLNLLPESPDIKANNTLSKEAGPSEASPDSTQENLNAD